MQRRKVLGAMVAAMMLGTAGVAPAKSDYPSQPIRWIVPYPAGGGTDVIARALAEPASTHLGENIVVDNRPGGSTNIGTVQLVGAKPGGYTVMSADNAALTFNEHLFKKLAYDPAKDFTYIHAFGRFPLALVVHPDFPASSMAEFLAYAKANPGKLNYASPGNGSPHHVGMELLKQAAELDIVHVPYRGAAPAMQDVMGGQVPVMLLDLPSGLQMMKSGRVRVLGIGSVERARALPDVPTFIESGIEGAEVFAMQGLVGPAGLSPEVAGRLADEIDKALKDPAVVRRFEEHGIEPLFLAADDFRQFARKESARWGEVIQRAGISMD